MADLDKGTNDEFVEVDGAKYKSDPENEGEALVGDDGELVPYEEPEESEEEKEAREKEEQEEAKRVEEEEPPTRKSAKDYILERKNKKIKKLEGKEGGDDLGGEGDDGEHEVTPEGKKAINKQVEEALKPILSTVKKNTDDQELKEVFEKHPDAKDMEKEILKFMNHDAYEKVPAEIIYLALSARRANLQKKRDKADEDAAADVSGGHGKRPAKTGNLPDFGNMGDEELGDWINKAKTGQV